MMILRLLLLAALVIGGYEFYNRPEARQRRAEAQRLYDEDWNKQQADYEYKLQQGARDAQLCRDRGGIPSIELVGMSERVKLLRCDLPCGDKR